MSDSSEKRKYKRSNLKANVYLNECQGGKKAKVEIHDISQGGLGFYCSEKLDVGTFYNADVKIWTQEVIPTIIKILRVKPCEIGNGYNYGSEFVIISDTDKFRIATYQLIND